MAVLSLQKQNKILIKNKIYAYDVNPELISLFKNIQQNKEKLYEFLQKYINEYETIQDKTNKNDKNDKTDKTKFNRNPNNLDEAKISRESYYYWIRKQFNNMDKNTIEYSALFIFLIKQVSEEFIVKTLNQFNVPYGHYKQIPNIPKYYSILVI